VKIFPVMGAGLITIGNAFFPLNRLLSYSFIGIGILVLVIILYEEKVRK
jgi:hypothetical protein